jgi:DNA-binding protein YbaB
MECPAKLFYTGKDEYANEKLEDSFLAALADGGFQVGELAKAYFSGGHDIKTLDYDPALVQTNELLKQDNVVIFEAAIRFKNLFIRTDILVKNGANLNLIEVKAKSYDLTEDGEFIGKKGGIDSDWKPYLLDVAFQKYVLTQAFPKFQVQASLMLADKTTLCPTNGLHQKFLVAADKCEASGKPRRRAVMTTPLTEQEQKQWILCQIPVDKICDLLYKQTTDLTVGPTTFVERIEWLASQYERDEKINCRPSAACADCEFFATAQEEAKGLKSGFKECWKQALKWTDKDFETPNILDIWDYKRKGKLLAENRIAMSDVMKTDIEPESDDKPGLSHSERQWLQVEKVQAKDNSIWIEKTALKREMQQWKFPLHFIDFETAAVAIPFNEGRRPYEQVAFQFSHHMLHRDGHIEHKGQYLNIERGVFPNYDFVRTLKKELEGDDGSIFRYAAHENTMLVAIDRQLAKDSQPPKDREALKQFIRSITNSTKKSVEQWEGKRSMIDLCKMVKRYYYAPSTNGSNSIKAILPALLNNSEYLKKKYSQPIYGGKGHIHSLNFQDKVWIKMEGDHIIDPYKQLPKMFSDVSDHDFKYLSEDDELRDGGAAMTAYARMQFEEMAEDERLAIRQALLRYCELDTLAMVMIYEAWADLVK